MTAPGTNDRSQRLKRALRENLHRRKLQQRSRSGQAEEAKTETSVAPESVEPDPKSRLG